MSDGKPVANDDGATNLPIIERVMMSFCASLDKNPLTADVSTPMKALKEYSEADLRSAIFGESAND